MNLGADVAEYVKNTLPDLHSMRDFYRGLRLDKAIANAAIGKMPDGTMNSHQYRIGYQKGGEGGSELLKREDEIVVCRSFEEIFDITEKVRRSIYRLGDLWSYDTALRIGFNLELYPTVVYVHSGVIKGVKKVLGHRPKGRTNAMHHFPRELWVLEPYEVENFLCVWGKSNTFNL